MRPAEVCSTLVTDSRTSSLILSREFSATIIVPSSRYPTPCPASSPALMIFTRMVSPGNTTGLSALAMSLMFMTSTPRSCAILFRL